MGLKLTVSSALLMSLTIGACSTVQPIDTNQAISDKPIQLQAGQGFAALVIDTAEPISQVILTPGQQGPKPLFITSVPTGKHLYLFAADAGTYCMHHFDAARTSFDAKADDQCFEVQEGKISYGGVFQPFIGFNMSLSTVAAVSQNDDWDTFWQLLKSTYPNLAASAFATPETISKEHPPAPPPSGICKLLSAQDASALLGAGTDSGVETNAIVPACAYSHSDQQVVRISITARANVDEDALNLLTPSPDNGWSKWVPVAGLADEARFTYRGDTSQIYVLKRHQYLFILTVEGIQRPDMEEALLLAAKSALSKL